MITGLMRRLDKATCTIGDRQLCLQWTRRPLAGNPERKHGNLHDGPEHWLDSAVK